MRKVIIFCLIIISYLSTHAQPLNGMKYDQMLITAGECFEKADFQNALENYQKAYEEVQDPKTYYNIAETYYMMKDYKNASKNLKRIISKDKTGQFPDANLLYGKSLKRLGQYQEALNILKDYALKTDDPDARDEAVLEIKGLELFKSLPENVEMDIQPLGSEVNKGFSLYGLQKRVSNDNIYYGSFNTSKRIVLDGKNNKVKSDDKEKSKKNDRSKKSTKKSNAPGKSDPGRKPLMGGEEKGNMAGVSGPGGGENQEETQENTSESTSTEPGEAMKGIGQIYSASRDNNGDYGTVTPMDKRFNRVEYYSVYPAFTSDGKKMCYTRMSMEGTVVLDSKLMYSEFNGSDWSAPMELANVNGDYFSKMASFGEFLGQQAIFFVSNMPGGNGGFDIYYSLMKDDGTFDIPVNIGKTINTKDDEITPYYVDGKLFYSTNGLPTLGGFDIFKSQWNGKEWSNPENLGKGYNSSVDDLGLTISPDGRSGFLLSNRYYEGKKKISSETCCNQAFKIAARDLVIQLLVKLVGEDDKPLNDGTVKLVDASKVKPKSPESKSNFSGNTFNFLLDSNKPYQAVVSKEGFEPQNITFTTAGIFDDFTIEKTVKLKKAAPEYEVIKINEPIRLDNIYYDFDDYKILPESEDDLTKLLDLMNKYPEMVIELSSHTDSRGTVNYNEKLSQHRAESAKNWLVKNGIESKRIKPVGYGESLLINKCKDGVDCTEEEHRMNRRTEFKIIAGPKEITVEKQVFKNAKQTEKNKK